MKTLVTGGTGFIGRHLVQALLKEGCFVRVLTRDPRSLEHLQRGQIEVLKGDVRDHQACEAAARGVERIFHLAAVIRPNVLSKEVYVETHVTGTRNLLDACIRHGIAKFVHCSTASVAGPLNSLPASESVPCNPSNIYEQTKYQAERLALDYCRQLGLPVTVIRPTWTYGPGDRRTLPLFKCIAHHRFLMIGRGDTLLHTVYVDHVVQGLLRAGRPGVGTGGIYIIADAEPSTVATLVNTIARLLDTKIPRPAIPRWLAFALAGLCESAAMVFRFQPPLTRRRVEFFTRSASYDISKAREELGYMPTMSLEEGLRRTILWYREHGYIRVNY